MHIIFMKTYNILFYYYYEYDLRIDSNVFKSLFVAYLFLIEIFHKFFNKVSMI